MEKISSFGLLFPSFVVPLKCDICTLLAVFIQSQGASCVFLSCSPQSSFSTSSFKLFIFLTQFFITHKRHANSSSRCKSPLLLLSRYAYVIFNINIICPRFGVMDRNRDLLPFPLHLDHSPPSRENCSFEDQRC